MTLASQTPCKAGSAGSVKGANDGDLLPQRVKGRSPAAGLLAIMLGKASSLHGEYFSNRDLAIPNQRPDSGRIPGTGGTPLLIWTERVSDECLRPAEG